MSKHSDDRPHPLRNEATWVGIVGVVAAGASVIGVPALTDLPATITPALQALGAGGALYASTKATAIRGEKHVTPTDDPKDNQGNRLVPEVVTLPPP